MDPRDRFTATVDQYVRYRPDYPAELLDWLAALGPGRRAADLGAGTGIFTAMLAERGWDVVAVEPNAAMRAAAVERGLRAVDGSAEATGLPDGAVDLAVAAQALHWFDLDRALPEIDRILAPGGHGAAAWNVRVDHGFSAAYERVLDEHAPEYRRVAKPRPALAALQARRPGGRSAAFPHAQRLDREGLRGRAWSSSYVVHSVVDREAFDRALDAAFDAHVEPDSGTVEIGYETVAYAWARGV